MSVAGPPAFAMISAALARFFADEAAITVCAPAPAKAAAIARPMPRLPPVTTTILPSNSRSIFVIHPRPENSSVPGDAADFVAE